VDCPECGGRVVYDGREYACSYCGLVVEEEIVLPSMRVDERRVDKYARPGTLMCDIQLRKIDRRLKQMVRKEIDEEIIGYIKTRRRPVDTRELWEVFGDRFSTKTEFYELLRRLRNQGWIKKGYVAVEV